MDQQVVVHRHGLAIVGFLILSFTVVKSGVAQTWNDLSELQLGDWQTYLIGPMNRDTAASSIYDYGAHPAEFEAQTLGELKRELQLAMGGSEP